MRPILPLSMLVVLFTINTSFKSSVAGKDDFHIVIEKHKYEMRIYDSEDNWLITYPVVFGNKDLSDKMMEGDRKTPEGVFHIASKRPHEKWNHFLALDYPTQDDYAKFNQRKAQGIIPADAKIGGSIGIHGTWPHEDFAIDQFQNWTLGCISTKNEYMEEIFTRIAVGTKVVIKN